MRIKRITKEVQLHDRKLFAANGTNGQIWIMREGFTYRPYDVDGNTTWALEPRPHYVMALTDNWSQSGKSVEWGLEPIMARLRYIDGWTRDVWQEDVYNNHMRSKEQKDRQFQNETEAFLKDFRPQFAKTFEHVNVSSMEKIDKRKQGELKHGNR